MSVIVLGPNSLLQIGQQTIIIGRIRSRSQQLIKRPRNIIKVGLPTQIEKSAPASEETLHTCQNLYKYRRLAPHLNTTHLLILL
jgi:hypothetical protein